MELIQNDSLGDVNNFENYDNFFSLYHIFLCIDKKYALIKGRNREIIRNFLIWYFDINEEHKHKEQLLNQIMEYEKKCEDLPYSYPFLNRNSSQYEMELNDLQKPLKFTKQAIKLYLKWRDKA